ncbi:RNA polymerase sigma-70 factor (ECF subfamily) [Dysgonomonas hofstadii]|uniref:RNA polymerase sigma-70 factor (ECF subfamily) n=1 Tax=Dysgonomonas hofstadii TaxID=637886 RepID=A0A840CU26_9BACT|nr:RNA polymerase sigma-70 factor [Dysgonomonas hofstadii]MBB4038179.1 RNA polymerase sigma-70 factor (ECF subfamily) [Dysgonomonas hofstadii]
MEKANEKIMLLKALSLGDRNAFRTVFLNYFPKVKGFIAHLLKNTVIAEDLSQEIFINIWESKETLTAIRSFDAYIYRMAKNAVINQIKRDLYHNEYIKYETAKSEDFSLEEEIFAKEIRLLIDLTVTKMPDQRRRIYNMSRVEGLKNDEIAEKLHISKKTVENHLNMALKEIRKSISFMLLFFI